MTKEELPPHRFQGGPGGHALFLPQADRTACEQSPESLSSPSIGDPLPASIFWIDRRAFPAESNLAWTLHDFPFCGDLSMSRPIWKGSIFFGLIEIPVSLHTATSRPSIRFKTLDRRDLSPVGNRRYNKRTGEEVPREEVVKGYEYEEGRFVTLEDQEIRDAAAPFSRSLKILGFVDINRIEPLYYDRPYYLGASPEGERPYALLREALTRTGRAGLARVVLRTKEHLAALLVKEDLILLQLLRYGSEIHPPEDVQVPDDEEDLTIQELRMAEELIETMAIDWQPDSYRDEFSEELRALIARKIEGGAPTPAEEPSPPHRAPPEANLLDRLKESISREETRLQEEEPERRPSQPPPEGSSRH